MILIMIVEQSSICDVWIKGLKTAEDDHLERERERVSDTLLKSIIVFTLVTTKGQRVETSHESFK